MRAAGSGGRDAWRFLPGTMVTPGVTWRRCDRDDPVSLLISQHRTFASRGFGSMRQTWDPDRARALGGSWFWFAMLTCSLIWLAAGQIGHGPGPRTPAAKGDAAPAEGRRRHAPRRRRRPPSRAGGAPAEGADSAPPREHAPVGDPGVGADRALPAPALDLFHGPGDPPVHGIPRQRGGARQPWSRSSRPRSATRNSRKPTTSARITTRSWPGWFAPGSPTCPTAGPRPRKPCWRCPTRS